MASKHKRKRGRPPKMGERYRSGHLKKIRRGKVLESPATVAAGMPHRKTLGERALDQRAESELGRMYLRGDLNEDGERDATVVLRRAKALLTAGETYAALWRGYIATLDGPRWPWEGQGRGLACAGCPIPEERKFCLCDFRKRIYLEANDVLISTGSGAVLIVHLVAIDDRSCPAVVLPNLKLGLSALADHFGLTRRRISGHKSLSSPNRSLPASAGTGSEP
jgi:hypothetical protein